MTVVAVRGHNDSRDGCTHKPPALQRWRRDAEPAQDHHRGRQRRGGVRPGAGGPARLLAADGAGHPGQPGRPAAGVPLHRGAGQIARPGAGREDRQHRERAAADRARPGRHRLRAAGRRRAEPVLRDLLLAHPAGRRPGPQCPRRRPAADPPVRPARVRVLGSAAPAAAGGGAGPDRRSLRRAGQAAISGTASGSPRTTCTPAPASCSPKPTARAPPGTSASGSGRPGGRHGHRVAARWRTRPRRSPSAGRRGRAGGWSGWMARPRRPGRR